jgi:uncharacterized protein
MKISGAATMHAPPWQVWAALLDPAVLAATIPGCERLTPTGSGACQLTATAGVASLQGTYAGQVTLSQRHEPASFALTVRGAGGPGTVTATVAVRLTPAHDGTELSYDADVTVGGRLAGVGQRLLASAARRLAAEFLRSVDTFLAGNGAVVRESVPPAVPRAAPVPPLPESTAAAYGRGFATGILVGAAVALGGTGLRRAHLRRGR